MARRSALGSAPVKWRPPWWSAASLLPTLGLDLWSKAWAEQNLVSQPPRPIIPGWLQLELVLNPGSAFGALSQRAWGPSLLTAANLAFVAGLSWLILRPGDSGRSGQVALGLMLAGVLGNLQDRLFRVIWVLGSPQRGVLDFIVLRDPSGHRWPAFNAADLALLAGLILWALGSRQRLARAQPPR